MNAARRKLSGVPAKDQTRLKIEQMEAEREERRRSMLARKKQRAEEEQRNIAAGNPGDVDFIGLVRKWRQDHAHDVQPLLAVSVDAHPRICICVRKRPISDKERNKLDHDSVTCLNPAVWIHSAKYRVDGITKYLDHGAFHFDYAFDENVSTDDIYRHTAMPLLDFVCSGNGGRATVFAYGQTGSGKTYTMNGIQEILREDLFLILEDGDIDGGCTLDDTLVMVSFFEMYGGYVQDLLNDRKRLKILEDGKGEINVTGLVEVHADNPESLRQVLDAGNSARTTHTTEANDTSSRSHAICQIMLRNRASDELKGKLSLVDLAGSERGSDTKSHNAQRRAESMDINTSLLALKECIRALDMNKKNSKHVPYRASKLTLILKDCFTSDRAMTTMIATVSPGASSADHSLNTLRYADRIKEKRPGGMAAAAAAPPPPPLPKGEQSLRRTTDTRTDAVHGGVTRELNTSLTTTVALMNASRLDASAYYDVDSTTLLEHDNSIDSQYESILPEEYHHNNRALHSALSKASSEDEQFLLYTSRSEEESFDHACGMNNTIAHDSNQAQSNDEPPKESDHDENIDVMTKQSDDWISTRDSRLPELEETILNMHMNNIHENADLLAREGLLLKDIQHEDISDEDMERYVTELEQILERKEDMILAMQEKMVSYQEQAQKQQRTQKL